MVSSKMASVRRLWKLKASIQSAAGYNGDFSRIGRTSRVFDIEALSTQSSILSVTGSATTLCGCSLLLHPHVFPVRKFFSSSRTLAAGDQSSSLDGEGVSHTNLRLLSGACCLPHPKKVETGGEDAYFICPKEQVVGIADGVGGWADEDVDAGDYARELMVQSSIAAAQEPHGHIDPARVMMQAYERTKFRGSSTACILALSNNVLRAANLGDSGFMLMRNGRSIFKSPVQQHQFNFPFQLESGGSDSPSAAEVFSLNVAAGDIVVAGTDGVFDNLFDTELMGIVVHSTRVGLDPQITAQNIVAFARERAEDRSRQTPFSTAAQEAGFRFYGGKMDDITAIVSYITTTNT